MERLKITAHLLHNKVIINDLMYFDGILYDACLREQRGDDYYWNVSTCGYEGSQYKQRLYIPIKVHTDEPIRSYDNKGSRVEHKQRNAGVYLSSRAYFDKLGEYKDQFRKRFEDLQYEKRGYEKKKVYTGMGKYKNYDLPYDVLLTDKLHWIVVGEGEYIERLLQLETAIGKEQNRGYGRVSKREIESTSEEGERHFPTIHFASHEIQERCRVRPPYGRKEKRLKCAMRRF